MKAHCNLCDNISLWGNANPCTQRQSIIQQPCAGCAGGCIPASKSSLHKALKAGSSALVLVGGIAEMFMLERDKEVIMLRKRRGFVRAAIEAGVPILPVYYFGQSKLLSFGPKCAPSA
jgi:Diacylglycerol acyltransferase